MAEQHQITVNGRLVDVWRFNRAQQESGVLAIVFLDEFQDELRRQLLGPTRPTKQEELSKLQKALRSRAALRSELTLGMRALFAASDDSHMRMTHEAFRRIWSVEKVEALVECLLGEAEALAEEVGGEEGEEIRGYFGVGWLDA
ncbi:uncharacterized protein LTR77_003978 [Saxophila tyrrhenica]|uniref:Uncharacterized protein n=1 Tax=Saxophila tyrrhenica TaxID=1690608 RepID=A0AAV9PFM5_9PEZI|nr:hypothetical protein LTR77_003978 [Saxophila tyrrhenica]